MTAPGPKSKKKRTTSHNLPGCADDLSEAFVLLDNSSGSGPPSLLFSNPVKIIKARDARDVPRAIKEIEEALKGGLHAAGYFSYELGYALEPKLHNLMPPDQSVPLIWFGIYNEPIQMSDLEVEQWLSEIARSESHEFSDVSLAWNERDYLKRFTKVIEYIKAGDIYQLNLTFKALFQLSGSPLTFYKDLRAKQRVSYGAIVDTGEATILSASPEIFINKTGDTITTRPMKGTAPRAGLITADAEQRRILKTDIKQRAENLMIVDLMRNDIGRISQLGSVKVTDLFTVETFQTLHQMTSGVRAKLKPDITLKELLAGIFPPGSITGAPKIRAMELIAQLESEARGVYCGSIGHLAPDGSAQLNVVIRTPVIMRDGRGEMGIGSGVVYDSKGPTEYAECLLKMKFLTDPPKSFELIETMLVKPDGDIALRDRHIERLRASAQYFAYRFNEKEIQDVLDADIATDIGKTLRLRLTLAENGTTTITKTPITLPDENTIMYFEVSPTILDSTNPFLFHKTTRRELYDREWEEFSQKSGSDEVIYFNENGHLCEGSRTNIFIKRDGVLLTPPLTDGLLPGTFRADLIETGKAVETTLTRDDLEQAESGHGAVFVGNSVRGLVKALPVSSK